MALNYYREGPPWKQTWNGRRTGIQAVRAASGTTVDQLTGTTQLENAIVDKNSAGKYAGGAYQEIFANSNIPDSWLCPSGGPSARGSQ